MKAKFMCMTLLVASILLSFMGCSKDSDKGNESDVTQLTLKVVVPGASTYAVGESNVDKQPKFNDAKIYFTDGAKIRKIVSFAKVDKLTSTGENIDGIPVTATQVYVIANEGVVSANEGDKNGQAGPLTDESNTTVIIAEGDDFSKLQKLMIKINAQVNPVNQLHLLGKSTFTPVISGTASILISLRPAISCIEIEKIEADQSVVAAKRITQFDLQGIYINNTYTMISVDNAIYPDNASIAYDYQSTVWNTSGTYPAAFCNESSSFQNKVSYTAGGTNRWGYYVVPAQKKSGDAYVGNTMNVKVNGVPTSKVFGACPLIVLKVNNVKVNDADKDAGNQGKSYYVTVSKYYEKDALINYFEGGYVYDISSISFNDDHLSDEPNVPTIVPLSVKVEVKTWERKPVTPGF